MHKIIGNIFSNWAGLIVSVIIAFVVSPIIVNTLGKELYGIWTIIISITGYFTVLDFGVNTAIVRYVSSSFAQKNYTAARSVYSTSIIIFAIVAIAILLFSAIFGYFLPDIFDIHQVARSYIYIVFVISAIDLASGLIFSVILGSLVGLQEFKLINGTSISVNIVRSVILVWSLHSGASLLTLAILQLVSSIVRTGCQYAFLRKKYKFIYFERNAVCRKTFANIYSYSVYSFIIAISLKLLFYTDSVVIGALIGVEHVAFYAIPSSILDYLEKFIWAMIAVLIPVISANQAKGVDAGNAALYIIGTRYSLIVIMPIVITLYFYGDDFICLWMGPEFGERSLLVLRYLLIGFTFSFSQLIAHGILKGISKHKILAYILVFEALANLGMSVALAKPYGIEGVAVGTLIPLLLASVAIIFYTCRLLRVKILHYVYKSYLGPLLGGCSALIFVWYNQQLNSNYLKLILNSMFLTCCFLIIALPVCLEKDHRKMIFIKLAKFLPW